jgi:hypothetical protein
MLNPPYSFLSLEPDVVVLDFHQRYDAHLETGQTARRLAMIRFLPGVMRVCDRESRNYSLENVLMITGNVGNVWWLQTMNKSRPWRLGAQLAVLLRDLALDDWGARLDRLPRIASLNEATIWSRFKKGRISFNAISFINYFLFAKSDIEMYEHFKWFILRKQDHKIIWKSFRLSSQKYWNLHVGKNRGLKTISDPKAEAAFRSVAETREDLDELGAAKIEARLIAATYRDLRGEIDERRFRRGLAYSGHREH